MNLACHKKLCIHVRKILQPYVLVPAPQQHMHYLVLEGNTSNPDVQTAQSYKWTITVYFTASKHIALGEESSQEASSSSNKAIVSAGGERPAHPLSGRCAAWLCGFEPKCFYTMFSLRKKVKAREGMREEASLDEGAPFTPRPTGRERQEGERKAGGEREKTTIYPFKCSIHTTNPVEEGWGWQPVTEGIEWWAVMCSDPNSWTP